MNSKHELKAFVDPNLPRVLKQRIKPLELEDGDDPESLMQKAQMRKGQLELIAILEGMVRDQERKAQ